VTEAAEPSPTKKRRSWKRWAIEIAVVALVVLGFRAWQTRGAADGPAPALSATTITGEPVSLEGLGEPVLVHFWATWCGVCQAEEGNIDSVAEGHRVISVASQSGHPQRVAAYMAQRGLSFPVVNDPRGALSHRWGVDAYPTSFVVDADGRIRHVEVGYTTTLGLRSRLLLAGF